MPGSPAIDAGDNAICAAPETVNGLDQRGVVRPQGTRCDIGAYEVDKVSITFVKQVLTGPAQPGAWSFTLDSDPTPIAHNDTITLPVGSYIVDEIGPTDYVLDSAAGACAVVNDQIELTVTGYGGTCTITNRLKVGPITFFKVIIGGAGQASDWSITVAGRPTAIGYGDTIPLTIGSYTVTENGPSEYTLTAASGVCALDNGQLVLNVTEQGGTCTTISTRQTGQITFIKTVNGGTAQSSDWTFSLVNGPAGASLPTAIPHNSVRTLDTGSYALSESGPAGYAPVSASGACQLVNGQVQLTVALGNNTCTIVSSQQTVLVNEFFANAWVREGAVSGDGSQACVWLALNNVPSGPVTIGFSVRNAQVTLDKSSITLDANNWNRFDLAQRDNVLCLQAVDDALDDGGTEQCKDGLSERFAGTVVPNAACGDHVDFVDLAITSSADPRFGPFTPFVSNTLQDLDGNSASIDVLIQDDDVVGIRFLPSSLSIIEGNSGSYQVVLTSQPTGNVTVDNGQGAAVTFTPVNWNNPQSLSLTIPDNDLVDGSREQSLPHLVTSSDAAYQALSPILPVLILDNDSPSVEIVLVDASNGQLEVAEGGKTASYRIRLTAEPNADITVKPVVNEQVTVSPSSLTFTHENWNTFQTVVVTAVDDMLVEATLLTQIQHSVSSSNPNYDGQPAPVVDVQVLDNDVPNIEVEAPTQIQLSEGALQAAQLTTSYQLRLTSQPASNVTVQVHITGQVTASPSSLTFTPENWSTFQSVTLTAIDDAIDQGTSHQATVSHTVISQDSAYNGLVVADLPVLILDNDETGVLITPNPIIATVGVTNTYSVVLTSQPLGPVQIVFTSSGPFRITGNCADAEVICLTFTPENWNIPQTFSVFGLTTGSGQITYQVVSDDTFYAGLATAPVAVNVVDSEPQQPGTSQSLLFLPLVSK